MALRLDQSTRCPRARLETRNSPYRGDAWLARWPLTLAVSSILTSAAASLLAIGSSVDFLQFICPRWKIENQCWSAIGAILRENTRSLPIGDDRDLLSYDCT